MLQQKKNYSEFFLYSKMHCHLITSDKAIVVSFQNLLGIVSMEVKAYVFVLITVLLILQKDIFIESLTTLIILGI